jgi:hypothetical protein
LGDASEFRKTTLQNCKTFAKPIPDLLRNQRLMAQIRAALLVTENISGSSSARTL